LVDALVSGTSIRKDVQVRVLFRAQKSRRKSAFFILTKQGSGIKDQEKNLWTKKIKHIN